LADFECLVGAKSPNFNLNGRSGFADMDSTGAITVLNHKHECSADYGWIPSSALTVRDFGNEETAQEERSLLDCVPVMASTVLGLEMLISEPFIDLGAVSSLILTDVGATLHILRLIGKESAYSLDTPRRMADCVASLDVKTWFTEISAHIFSSDREYAAASALWTHSLLVAQYSQLVAESIENTSPEDAYLVGLLHEIKTFPKALGWPTNQSITSFAGTMFTLEGSLPIFVLGALRSVNESGPSSSWKDILATAHDLAGEGPENEASRVCEIDSTGINRRWKRFLPSGSELATASVEYMRPR
jgi:hypothetical protein